MFAGCTVGRLCRADQALYIVWIDKIVTLEHSGPIQAMVNTQRSCALGLQVSPHQTMLRLLRITLIDGSTLMCLSSSTMVLQPTTTHISHSIQLQYGPLGGAMPATCHLLQGIYEPALDLQWLEERFEEPIHMIDERGRAAQLDVGLHLCALDGRLVVMCTGANNSKPYRSGC